MDIVLRSLTERDNHNAAYVVKTVMPEFGCVGEGYSIEDPEMDDLYATYSKPRSNYFVVEVFGDLLAEEGAAAGTKRGGKSHQGEIVAVGGYAPLTGADPSVCELRKMYALPEARGFGIGKLLMDACLDGAKNAGFTTMYLETVTAMEDAARFYAKHGFQYIDGPMGSTGHSGCDLFMTRFLK